MHPSEAIKASEGEELRGKTIVLGVCGSIAAVEVVKLAREMIRHGADIYPVMSHAATTILHPNSVEFATGRKPVTELDGSVQHVDLCGPNGEADLLLIAPATANTISKMASGIDDTPVTTCATTAIGSGLPVIVAPAMDASMYRHPIVAENMDKLRSLGVEFIEPLLEEQKAKLAEVEVINARVMRRLGPLDMRDLRVLVIGGATGEHVDDVRMVTALSTGETGVELARAAFLRAAQVDLWMGRGSVSLPPYIRTWRFETTEDLLSKVGGIDHDLCIVPAAISDYIPKREEGKIPSSKKELTLVLRPNVKVLERIRKGFKGTLVGFKLESGVSEKELEGRASARLKELGLDFIVGNDVHGKGKGVRWLVVGGKIPLRRLEGSKREASWDLWSSILDGR